MKQATSGSFKPGQSGNPNGRPKAAEEFRIKARALVDELVLKAWEAEVRSMGDDWLKASELLAAYGYGKPSQSIDITADVTSTSPHAELSAEELRAIARSQLERENLQDTPPVK